LKSMLAGDWSSSSEKPVIYHSRLRSRCCHRQCVLRRRCQCRSRYRCVYTLWKFPTLCLIVSDLSAVSTFLLSSRPLSSTHFSRYRWPSRLFSLAVGCTTEMLGILFRMQVRNIDRWHVLGVRLAIGFEREIVSGSSGAPWRLRYCGELWRMDLLVTPLSLYILQRTPYYPSINIPLPS